MRDKAIAEVHFHDKHTVSCVVDTKAAGREGMADEMLIWTCLANRQMTNMGRDGGELAMYLRSQQPLRDSVIGEGIPTLIDHQKRAKKRFVCRLLPHGAGYQFKLSMKGFGGILGIDLGYYCPTSVAVLLRYLALRRGDDQWYADCLNCLCSITGSAYLAGTIDRRNANPRAFGLVVEALSMQEAWQESTDTEE